MPTEPGEITIDLGNARDQGPRPTCLSFSLSESHRAAIAHRELLSPESLHRKAAALAKKVPSEGLALHEAVTGLSIEGQTTEADWPYNSEQPLDVGCLLYRRTAIALQFEHVHIVTAIQSGLPISLIINVDLTFFGCDGQSAVDLIASSPIQGRHAVVICGYRTAGGGHEYLIKNSWGGAWGDRGYAWLTTNYIFGRSPQLVQV
jgi:hypothetical protein